MKKKFLCITLIIILLLSLSTSVFAERYAYSAGTNWGKTYIPGREDPMANDYTQNVRNSWTHYSSISDVTAKLSTSAFTKTYLDGTINGSLPRLNSNILFFNGHGSPDAILFSHQGDPRYATGISIGNDTLYLNYFDTIGLNNVNMNNVQLVSFVGCNTGTGNTNLLTKARERGALVAVRF